MSPHNVGEIVTDRDGSRWHIVGREFDGDSGWRYSRVRVGSLAAKTLGLIDNWRKNPAYSVKRWK